MTKDQPNSRLAVIGSGYWGQNLVRNFHDLHSLAAICDKDEGRRLALKTQYPACQIFGSYAEVLGDDTIEAVAIATPAETHADLVREALVADKDVYVEKPLCLDVPTGEALVALARKKGRVLMVGHLLWYHPAVLKLKELVETGELGRIQYIYSNRLNLGKIRREENILWSFAPHDISVILGLLGEMPDAVQSQGGNYLHQQIADVTVSLLSFPSGIRAHIFVSWLHPFKEQKLVVVGDRRMAVFNDVEPKDKLLLYPHSIEWKNQVPVASKAQAEPVSIDSWEPLRAECLHFLECVKTRHRPRTDGEEALRVLAVLQQCQQSLKAQPQNQLDASASPTPAAPPRAFFAHESAFIDKNVEIGEGTKIWHVSHILKNSRIGKKCNIGQNVVIGPNVTVGDRVKIQNNVSVYEGVTLEDGVFCGPSMVFTNIINPRSDVPRMHELRHTLVRRGASLGANCTVVCGATVGQYAFVGAGAVVTRDVPDYSLVVGTPARVVGWVCSCGEKLKFMNGAATCSACGEQYQRMSDNKITPVLS
ncbi:MAG: Gfo/Idh/MocA family oxidoreductase [Pyrinomonadaceae bacterium]|nr:Gfo/Idh/MocA family oxidoreductase [Pyrinomonadaceae bacterium]